MCHPPPSGSLTAPWQARWTCWAGFHLPPFFLFAIVYTLFEGNKIFFGDPSIQKCFGVSVCASECKQMSNALPHIIWQTCICWRKSGAGLPGREPVYRCAPMPTNHFPSAEVGSQSYHARTHCLCGVVHALPTSWLLSHPTPISNLPIPDGSKPRGTGLGFRMGLMFRFDVISSINQAWS